MPKVRVRTRSALRASLAALLVLSACAVEVGEPENAEVAATGEALVNGTATSARPEIGQIEHYINSTTFERCTGTLIGTEYFLTANHCINWSPKIINTKVKLTDAAGKLWTYTADAIYPLGAQKAHLYYDFQAGGTDDVALVRIWPPVPPSVATPAAMLPIWPTSGAQTIFGYGCTDRGTQRGGGFKQYATFDFGTTTGHLCSGDSGGPVVSGQVGENGAVWGVNHAYNGLGKDLFGNGSFYKEQIMAVIRRWDASSYEFGMDRQGSDYSHFGATLQECNAACIKDSACKALTFVGSGVFSPGTCWLKNAVPDWKPCPTCTSQSDFGIEFMTNRQGSDYSNFSAPRPDVCHAACARDAACKAYTFTVPASAGQQGRCWLKNAVPAATGATNTVSAIKRALESGYDRPGAESTSLTLAGGSAGTCAIECAKSYSCRAFTWVSASNTCKLKNGIPKPVAKSGVTSGVRRGFELFTDRPGSELRDFDMVNLPEGCQAECARDAACKAFSFTPAGFGGRNAAHCWLKSDVPAPVSSTGAISGLRGAEFF